MDIKETLDALFEVVVESDPAYQASIRQDGKVLQPYHDRLCKALGEEEADRFWDALMSTGATQQDCVFRSGLCLGLRLMALCL